MRGRRWNRVLVVTEVALACAVLMASALLVRSVTRMMTRADRRHRRRRRDRDAAARGAKYPDWPKVEQFYATLLEAVRRQPGVEAAGARQRDAARSGMAHALPGRRPPGPRAGRTPIAQHVCVSSGYFETVPRARSSRAGSSPIHDTADTEPVVVVNETFARRAFPGEDAIGRRIVSTAQQIGPLGRNLMFTTRIRASLPHRRRRRATFTRRRSAQAAEPVIYHTQRQFPFRAMTIVARGTDAAAVDERRSAQRCARSIRRCR